MKSVNKRMLVASLLVGLGFAAMAQTPPPAGPGNEPRGGMMQHGRPDPARMQARMEQRAAALKEKLKLTPAQEGAWATFTAAMKPPANMGAQRPDREAMAKLSTPERIDKMKAMRTQRDADMDKRAEAVKTFYATLSPEQKKVFDAQPMRGGPDHGRRGGHEGHDMPMPKPRP